MCLNKQICLAISKFPLELYYVTLLNRKGKCRHIPRCQQKVPVPQLADHYFSVSGFACPFVPYLPAACILINTYLLIDLG